jgi:hypothetical protein
MNVRQYLSGPSWFDLGVAGNLSWRGWSLELENVELICFDYRPAVVTRLIRQTPAAFFTG